MRLVDVRRRVAAPCWPLRCARTALFLGDIRYLPPVKFDRSPTSRSRYCENFADQAVIAMENARLLGELQQRTDELAARNSEFGERIEHQSATIDVLKAMSASPGDPQPVFDLIVRRARDLCNTTGAALFEFDGELVHSRSWVGTQAYSTPEAGKPTSGCFRWCRRAVPSLAGRFLTGRSFMCATWRPNPESARPFAIR